MYFIFREVYLSADRFFNITHFGRHSHAGWLAESQTDRSDSGEPERIRFDVEEAASSFYDIRQSTQTPDSKTQTSPGHIS